MNNRSENWYAELGKYITETLDIEKIPYLDYFVDKLKERKGLITKIKDFISPESRNYTSIAIHFLTGVLDEKALENMFGKPLLHDEFGEGFDGEYDEETDEQRANLNRSMDFEEFRQIIENNEDESKNKASQARQANFIRKGTPIYDILIKILTGE